MTAGRLLAIHPILPVTDLEASLAWYAEHLGFELAFRDGSSPDTYAGVRRDDVELHLMLQRPEQMPDPGRIMVRLLVDDPDALFAEFSARGLPADTHPVAVTAWGTREFALCDLNQHGLVFYRDL